MKTKELDQVIFAIVVVGIIMFGAVLIKNYTAKQQDHRKALQEQTHYEELVRLHTATVNSHELFMLQEHCKNNPSDSICDWPEGMW